MTTVTRIIGDEGALADLAARVAALLRTGDVVTLQGTLGAGKTTFARNVIRTLAQADIDVPSPTFTLVQTYDLPKISIWHFDLYRLDDRADDILELGWEEARRQAASLVEWPERLGVLMPRDRLGVHIDFTESDPGARHITFTPYGHWQSRLTESAI